jgi:hypothetical protein
MNSPSFYEPISIHLGLNNLDFSGYNKIQPAFANFEIHFANFWAFWPLEGQ